jgi:hypothetical protein
MSFVSPTISRLTAPGIRGIKQEMVRLNTITFSSSPSYNRARKNKKQYELIVATLASMGGSATVACLIDQLIKYHPEYITNTWGGRRGLGDLSSWQFSVRDWILERLSNDGIVTITPA